MENVEFFTLEVSSVSNSEFAPLTREGKVEEFSSFADAVDSCPYYSCFKGSDCVILVIRHVHFSQVLCEVSKFREPFKFVSYGKEN